MHESLRGGNGSPMGSWNGQRRQLIQSERNRIGVNGFQVQMHARRETSNRITNRTNGLLHGRRDFGQQPKSFQLPTLGGFQPDALAVGNKRAMFDSWFDFHFASLHRKRPRFVR